MVDVAAERPVTVPGKAEPVTQPAPIGSAPAGAAAADPAAAHGDRSALVDALATLPSGQRAAVVLRYWMDMTETEAAAVLGCSVGNVKSQASRALAKLRLSIDPMEGAGREQR